MMTHRMRLAIVLASFCLLSGAPSSRGLTLHERVEAQRSIERVYYGHLMGTAEPFEKAVSTAILEKKVRTYLKQSQALEIFWRNPVTSRALQAEWQRIARESRFPERLREIYDSLNNDPILIQECFVRPVLVERLARSYFASDPRMHGASDSVDMVGWDAWWQSVEADLDEKSVRTVADASTELAADLHGTGSSSGPSGISLDTASANAGCIPADSWTRGMEEKYPDARQDHSAVWTGTEMLIWGGRTTQGANVLRGNRYDPLTDSWRAMSAVAAPSPRSLHTAVWTGAEMLIWGGAGINSVEPLDSGGRYNPLSDSWSSLSSVGAPSPRYRHTAVWTGSRMVIWGGAFAFTGFLGDGGRYDPATDTWSGVSGPSLTPRIHHSAVWTGTWMIVWGGESASGQTIRSDGGLYDPATDQWTFNITNLNAPVNRRLHTAVWTGSRMIIWGGNNLTQAFDDGRLYDPVGGVWTTIPSFPPGRAEHRAIWTGSRMLIWGGTTGSSDLDTGGLFDPQHGSSGSWQAISTAGAPVARRGHTLVWTGSRAIVWGGGTDSLAGLDSGGRYDPQTDSWTPTSFGPSGPSYPRADFSVIWSGTHLIVWGGRLAQPEEAGSTNTGSRYDPVTDSWSPTSTTNAPVARFFATAVWAGNRMVVWGGATDFFVLTATGGRYDPISDSWSPTSLSGAPPPRSDAQAIWTGSEVILAGYGDYTSPVFDAYRYNPTSDTWAAASTVNQPEPRRDFSMTWTGTEVVVWGGQVSGQPSSLGTGAVYRPAADQWQAMSNLDAPLPRRAHSAVWTGADVLVWGGRNANPFAYFQDGAAYDPGSDQWSPLLGSSPPAARAGHVAIWTGTEMIIWGGGSASPPAPNDGARYNPSTQQWTPISTMGAPPPSSLWQGFWSGQFMLLWGGASSGGVYAPEQVEGDGDADGYTACQDCDDADPNVHPGAAETCNGRDDDCDAILDNGIDADGDGHSGCGGPDCNDANSGVWGLPAEVSGVAPGSVIPTVVSWDSQAVSAGSSTLYDVVSGSISSNPGISFNSAVCLQSDGAGTTYQDNRPNPILGRATWYLVRAVNSCAVGTYGASSNGLERPITSCP